MPATLAEYHPSNDKIANILQQYRKERGISKVALGEKIGVSYDTVVNILSGKVQLKLETAIKLCVALAIPIGLLTQLILQNEDIDFADDVLLYDPVRDEVMSAVEHDVTASDIVPDSVAAAAADTTPPDPAPTVLPAAQAFDGYTREELTAVLDRVCACHEQHVADMRANADRQQEIIRALIEKR